MFETETMTNILKSLQNIFINYFNFMKEFNIQIFI